MIRPALLALVLAVLPAGPPLLAQTAPAKGAATGLPIPRFVSLGADKVNVRTGPGDRYPVNWQFVRRHLPVEVTAEFENWRRIRDADGAEGWVHKSLLSGRRYALVAGPGGAKPFHAEPDRAAPVVLRAEPGVQARVLACRNEWCRLEVEQRRGWLPRQDLWGVYPGEAVD